MRRLSLIGLALGLGVAGGTASAQMPAPRSVQFGRPVELPDQPPSAGPGPASAPDSEADRVRPAGLFSSPSPASGTALPLQGQPAFVTGNGGMAPNGVPIYSGPLPPGVGAVPGMPLSGYPVGPWTTIPGTANQPLGQPRPIEGGPSVTEIKEGSGFPKPMPPSVGTTVIGQAPIPSVGPGLVGPIVGPQPQLDDPLFGGCLPDGVGQGGMGSVFGGDPTGSHAVGSRLWLSAEYLLWWTRSANLPVLATTTTVPGSDAFLGAPGTVPVLGGGNLGQTRHAGARFGIGWWFGDQQLNGIDFRYFFLGQNGSTESVMSAQYPALTRPFFNLNAGIPFGEAVAFPGFAFGSVSATLQNSLWGAEVNWRRSLIGGPCSPCCRLDGLSGFRYLNFNEQLDVTETFARTGAGLPSVGLPGIAGGTITDRFRTTNNFYGGQMGLTGEVRRGKWFVNGRGTVALGTTYQTAEITGAQTLFTAAGVTQTPGGLLTVPGANIGHFSQNRFAVLPEVGVNVGCQITPHLRAFVGYNFLYLSSVLRPAGTINPNLDVARIPNFPLVPMPAPLPGPAQPLPVMRGTDFFAQGINFGMSYNW